MHITLTRPEAAAPSVVCSSKVFIVTLPPLYEQYADRNAAVQVLNLQIAALALRRHATLLDYNKAVAGHPEYVWDGVHITLQGTERSMRLLREAKVV